MYDIYNGGELKRIGEGNRRVVALAPGRKFITIVDPFTCDVEKIARDVWEGMRVRIAVNCEPKRVRKAMKERLQYVEPTKALKEALASI